MRDPGGAIRAARATCALPADVAIPMSQGRYIPAASKHSNLQQHDSRDGATMKMMWDGLSQRLLRNSIEMRNSTYHLIQSMADTLDQVDTDTNNHSRRVAALSRDLLQQMGIHGAELRLIAVAALVHDMGKLGIPTHLLTKPSVLTAEEQAVMRRHPDLGADLLMRYSDFAPGVTIVRHHHEAWDGTGYPSGLKGTHIPFGARLIAVVESFDAMTSDLPYHQGIPYDEAAQILRQGRSKQWDASIVDSFLRSAQFSIHRSHRPERPSGP